MRFQSTTSGRGHRCGLESAGYLEYGRGSREPSLPQNGTQETASGQQTPASSETWLEKPGESRKQVARLHYRITCMRDDVLQKLTTRLANCYGIIGVEDLTSKAC